MTQATAEDNGTAENERRATLKSAGHVIVELGSEIEKIVCRHEGGATYMAEADGKINQLPDVAMVIWGPGAANAHVGLHTAWQDSTPMVLGHAERASEIVADTFFAAMSGRPGPVVIGLPEDVIRQQIPADLHPPIPVAAGGMTGTDSDALAAALSASTKKCPFPPAQRENIQSLEIAGSHVMCRR